MKVKVRKHKKSPAPVATEQAMGTSVPTVKQLEDYIKKLKDKRDIKNAEYKAADQKSRELSEATREIEKYLSQEQSRDQQKKKERNDLE